MKREITFLLVFLGFIFWGHSIPIEPTSLLKIDGKFETSLPYFESSHQWLSPHWRATFSSNIVNHKLTISECPADISKNNDNGECGAVVNFTSLPTTDLSGYSMVATSTLSDGDTFPVGITTVTYQEQDDSSTAVGDTCTFTVTITDNENPELASAPADQTVNCPDDVPAVASLSWTDNCDAGGTVSGVDSAQMGDSCSGTITRTWNVSDTSGNNATQRTQVFTIIDNIAPTAATPSPIYIQCASDIPPSDISVITGVSDNCSTPTVVFVSDVSDGNSNPETIIRTYSVTDGCTNSINITQTIEIEDTTPPIASNPSTLNFQCTADVPTPDINVVTDENDNCSIPTVAFVSDVSNGNSSPEVITRTYSVTDESSNTINVTQTITVNDTTNPNAVCIGGTTTVVLDSSGNGFISTSDVDAGSSDNCGSVNLSFAGGEILNAALGKPATQSSNSRGGVASRAVDGGQDGIFVNGSVSLTRSRINISEWWEVDLEEDVDIALIRIWNRTDASFITDLNNFNITLYDDGVDVSSQNFNMMSGVSLDITSLSGVADKIRVTQLIDSKPIAIAEFEVFSVGEIINFDCSDIGSQTITIIATDDAGNANSCVQNITVVDNQMPSIACPPNLTLNIDDDTICTATGVDLGTPTINDNCSLLPVTNNAPSSFPIGVTSVIWTVEDTSGNTATCTQTVTVVDNIDPVFTCPENIVQNNDTGFCSAVVTFTPPSAEDCSNIMITKTDSTGLDSGDNFPVGVTTLSYQVVDDGNLVATCSFTITVNDIENPTVTAPSNITPSTDSGACGSNIAIGNATFADNCPGSNLSWAMTGATTLSGSGQVGSKNFNVGMTTIAFKVTDAVGLETTDTMVVDLSDNENPSIMAPANITVSANSNCQVPTLALGAPSTSDNCGVASVSNNSSPPYLTGTTTITWTVFDTSGNSETATQTVTVIDNSTPTLTLPQTNITKNTNSEGDYNCNVNVNIPTVSFGDNCSGSTLSWQMTGTTNNGGSGMGQVPSPYNFNLGITTIDYTVTDTASPPKTLSKTLIVNILDNEKPLISTTADVTVPNSTGICGATVSWVEPTASDNCSVLSFGQTTGFSNPFTFPIGTTPVTYEASDVSGNTITESFSVTVVDSQAPTITHPNQSSNLVTTTSTDGTGNCTVSIAIPNATYNDNCTVSETSWSMTGATTNSGSGQVGTKTFNIGDTVITYTASDGNTPALQTTLSITVKVTDDEDPTLNLPNTITVNSCNTVVNYSVTGNDNCGVASITQIDGTGLTSGSIFPSGTTTLEYEVLDVNGNSLTDTFNINVVDGVLPIINCPANVTINNNSGLCSGYFDYQVVASDDCNASPTLSWAMTGAISKTGTGQISAADKDFPVGTTTVTFTVNDGTNTDTCSSTVTIVDNESPIVTCPTPAAAYNTDLNSCTTSLTFVASVIDNCDTSPTLSYTIGGAPITFPYNFPIGTTTIDVVSDTNNGLTGTCSFNVLVEDNQTPVIACPTVADSYPVNAGQCTASLSIPATAADNCNGSPVLTYSISGTPITFPYNFPLGSTNITATANDGNGQTDSCDYTVIVTDTQNPVANCVSSIDITLNATGEATIVAEDLNNNSTDNCGIQNLSINKSEFDCGDLGQNTIILTVRDSSNNLATCSTIVNVLDPSSNASVDISVDKNPICQGEDLEFTAIPTNGGSTPSYEWFIEGVSQGNNSPVFQPITTVNDGDEIYVQMQSSLSSCDTPTQSNSIFITVNPTPINTGPMAICVGSTGNLSSNSGGTWVSNNPGVASVNNSGLITGIMPGTVTFTFTSASGGCLATTNAITVNALPVLTAPADVCIGLTKSLTPNSGGTWTSNDVSIATVTNTGGITGVAVGNVSFTFINANGCAATTTSVSVLESPVIDVITSSSNPLCAGGTATLQATILPSSNPATAVTLINYDFNLGYDTGNYSDYDGKEIAGILSDMNSSNMAYNYGYSGINTGINAFTTNTITGGGNSLRQQDDNGTNDDGEWIFNIEGSVLDDYRDFSVYFQAIRNNAAGSPKYIEISYRKNGTGGFIDVLRFDMDNNTSSNSWREVLFTLPAVADNANQLEIKLYVNDGRNSNSNSPDIRIDNFQLQGKTGGDIFSYSWTADTGAASGLPANAATPSSANSIIQVSPTATTNYTVTVISSGNGCSASETKAITVTPAPEITVLAEYCPADDPSSPNIDESELVQLIASSPSDPNVDYVWQTDPVQTGPIIYVDIADIYVVLGSVSGGCSSSGSISIAEELVIDGDFTNIDLSDPASFPFTTSTTTYIENQPGLVPAGQGELYNGPNIYTIAEDAKDVHSLVKNSILDHTGNTDGPRNWMLVNSDQGPFVWQQLNTTVLPNTTYYFSGWIRNWLNGNPAKVRFEVDGVLIGTQQQSTNSWQRFYGNWTSGPAQTSVDIRIANINAVAGGNDFGIDDISFATLSTFVRLETELGTDSQEVCENTPIDTIIYDFGGGLAPPEIEWKKDGTSLGVDVFPLGLSFTYNGLSYIINGTPEEFGDYTYTIETTSTCDVKSADGTLTVNEEPQVFITNPVEPSCFNDDTLAMTSTLVGTATSGSWSTSGTGTFSGVSGNGTSATYNFGSGETGMVTLTFTSNDPMGPCEPAIATFDFEIIPYSLATVGSDINLTDCSITSTPLIANDINGSWSVTSGQSVGTYFFSDPTDNEATFTGESGETYVLQWEAENAIPCDNTTATLIVEFGNCGNSIDFDGIDDFLSFANNYDMNSGEFSLEAWIKLDNVSGAKTIISKRNGANLTSGYDLSLVNNRLIFGWNNGGQLQSNQTINNTRWYHTAVSFNGTDTYTLYIDGYNVGTTTSGTAPLINTNRFLVGAMDRTNATPINYLAGAIDEIRIWNTALTATQIRSMMNQEIKPNGSNISGVAIPMDITGLQWSNLMGYYQMTVGSNTTITNGHIDDISTMSITPGSLNKMTTLQDEFAPLPYITATNGSWDNPNTWVNGSVQQLPNSSTNTLKSPPPTWHIVRTQHTITTDRATSLLGLMVDTNRFSVINNQGLNVSNYLKIDGTLDLVGESQLVQPMGSLVDATGIGNLERDQQGTSNLYNYNYWTSPVSNNGLTFTLSNVLYDGFDVNNPQNVNWTTNVNSYGMSHPVTQSRRWLFTYKNFPENSYAEWTRINENTSLDIGQGYTMKGSGASNVEQNYTFIGKPNNGSITTPVTANYQALVGNPYPSALDANKFIDDNEIAFEDGSLQFWEHSPSNNSHILSQYEGGYAIYNKSGGVAATSSPADSNIAGVGNANKIPGRYLPIGMGFFVTGDNSGGTILFQNSQRIFKKESAESVFLRSSEEGDSETRKDFAQDDEETIKRLRLDFISPENAIRHLLLAFVENGNATNGIDYGYDAANNDDFSSDMCFDIEGAQFVIQGVGPFDITQSYPLIITLKDGGSIQILLDELENFEEIINVFIYDALLGTYTKFNNTNYQITLAAGEYKNRFYLAFQEDETLSTIDNEFKDIDVGYLQNTDEIYVKTPPSINVKQIYLINIAGQTVGSWNATNLPMSNVIKIQVENVSEGNYILQVESNYSTFNKKIIIQY